MVILPNDINCDNTSSNNNPDFVTKYRRVDFYSNYIDLPKKIKVAIHVFTGDTATGLQNNAAGIAALKNIIKTVNGFYDNNSPFTDLLPDSINAAAPLPTNIHFDWGDEDHPRIYFYSNTKYWAGDGGSFISRALDYIKKNNALSLDALPIIFCGNSGVSFTRIPYPDYIGGGSNAGALDGDEYVRMNSRCDISQQIYAYGQNLMHELGHAVDLMHTYGPGSCYPETCDENSTDYLSDLFGIIPKGKGSECLYEAGWSCPLEVGKPWPHCSNDVMDGVATVSYYWSPLQIDKMHRACYIKTLRKYVEECPVSPNPFVINHNELWNFDIRLYQNLEINSGDTLTIKGKVHLPENGKIIIKKGGTLIVDGGTIDAACIGKWQGIIRKGKKAILIVKNNAIIKENKK